ncbi:MAG: ABC transporter ATP-binding protein [Ignavibacteria bacterium]|nr:MAG: ABC transporter ATP-binding protein [Ignavibacteria bacterium]
MIDVVNLSVQFTGIPLFENVNFKINKGDKISLVGANGSGKSTLLKIIKGIEQPETGNVLTQKGIRIGYLPQEYFNSKQNLLFQEVRDSLDFIVELETRENELNKLLTGSTGEVHEKYLNELGEIHHKKELENYYSIDAEIKKVLLGLGFKEEDFSRKISEFSGGWIMRIELAKILLGKNDLLLLDEPTNHLDIDSLLWLEDFLSSYRGAILLVSHDKNFVNKITDKTLEIFNKKINFFKGNYDKYLIYKAERDKQLEAERNSKLQKIKDTQKFIERFRYKASKAKQVQSRIKMLEKMEVEEIESDEKEIKIRFPAPPRSGVVPVELKNVSKSFGEKLVFENVNLIIERGDKIAFVGPNGAGKTTLSRIIGQKLEPTSGEIIYGHNTVISFFSQETTDDLDLDSDIISLIYNAGKDLTLGQARSLLGAFLFSDEDVFKKIKVLSGGEKARTALAKLLLTEANLIILDEPTNHLDYKSKKVLQEALQNFDGTLIIVSHDIDFLEPIVNKVVDIRDHKIKEYVGGIDYYLQKHFEVIEQPSKANNKKENTRKDTKRKEAELRQEKYKLTKPIIKKIESLESQIENLENEKIELESKLADESVYSVPEKLKETNLRYTTVKDEIDELTLKWAELNDELEEINSRFEI